MTENNEQPIQRLPIRWTAPESIQNGSSHKASDIWSYGVCLWEIFSRGATPYAGLTNEEVVRQVTAGFRLQPPIECPISVSAIMISCWEIDPEQRPRFEQILARLETTETVETQSLDHSKLGKGKQDTQSPFPQLFHQASSSTFRISSFLNEDSNYMSPPDPTKKSQQPNASGNEEALKKQVAFLKQKVHLLKKALKESQICAPPPESVSKSEDEKLCLSKQTPNSSTRSFFQSAVAIPQSTSFINTLFEE